MKQRFSLTSIVRQPRGLRWSEIVKAKTLISCVAFMTAPLLSAQVNCPAPTATTSSPMVCQYPYNGAVLANIAFGGTLPTTPEGIAAYQALLKQLTISGAGITTPINASIATQLAQLPMPSAAAGTVTLKLPGSDIGSPFNNLGPILTDRPETYPRRGFFLSFAYQHFNFTEIDGLAFNKFNLGAKAPGIVYPTNGGDITGDLYVSLQSKIDFQMDQYIGMLTYGLTRSTDITVAVPVSNVTMNVTSGQYRGYIYTPTTSTYTLLAEPGVTAQVNNVTAGSASGIGDVTVNFKQMLFGQEGRYAGAVGAYLRFPTGDADNYLGSGCFGGNVYGIVEYRGSIHGKGIAPHVRVGYQWNGQSQLMNIQAPTSQNLPGGVNYAVGADFGLHRTFSIAIDGVGNQYVNAPVASNSIASLPSAPSSKVQPNPSTIVISNPFSYNTYTTFNFSGGFKWIIPGVHNHLVLYANVMVPVNDVGLHSDPVPLVGIAFKR
jgi:hypothetical protein